MALDLRVGEDDLKTLFIHSRMAYGNIGYIAWKKKCKEAYMSYFNDKKLFNVKQKTYSQWVNSQTVALTSFV